MAYQFVVIKDNSGDVYLLEIGLKQAGISFAMHLIQDAETARNFIQAPSSILPNLVLLDLNLPRIDGEELLRLVRPQPSFENVPVVTWSSLPSPKDRMAISGFQGTHIICKPASFDAFTELGALIGKVLNSSEVQAKT